MLSILYFYLTYFYGQFELRYFALGIALFRCHSNARPIFKPFGQVKGRGEIKQDKSGEAVSIFLKTKRDS